MTFDLSIIFDIPESQYLRCVASNVNVAFAFKIRNHRALRFKQRNLAYAFKIRNHRALCCFLDLSNNSCPKTKNRFSQLLTMQR